VGWLVALGGGLAWADAWLPLQGTGKVNQRAARDVAGQRSHRGRSLEFPRAGNNRDLK